MSEGRTEPSSAPNADGRPLAYRLLFASGLLALALLIVSGNSLLQIGAAVVWVMVWAARARPQPAVAEVWLAAGVVSLSVLLVLEPSLILLLISWHVGLLALALGLAAATGSLILVRSTSSATSCTPGFPGVRLGGALMLTIGCAAGCVILSIGFDQVVLLRSAHGGITLGTIVAIRVLLQWFLLAAALEGGAAMLLYSSWLRHGRFGLAGA